MLGEEHPIIIIFYCTNLNGIFLITILNCLFTLTLENCSLLNKYTKYDKSSVINYHPISLLPTISKVYEKIAYNQLIEFLEENNLLYEIQHGFRSGMSAVQFLKTVIDSVDQGEHILRVFMDLSKTFDRVHHAKCARCLTYL